MAGDRLATMCVPSASSTTVPGGFKFQSSGGVTAVYPRSFVSVRFDKRRQRVAKLQAHAKLASSSTLRPRQQHQDSKKSFGSSSKGLPQSPLLQFQAINSPFTPSRRPEEAFKSPIFDSPSSEFLLRCSSGWSDESSAPAYLDSPLNLPQEPASTNRGGPGEQPGNQDLELGSVVGGKYRLLKVLGRGGAGVTYEAEEQDGGKVAAKVLSLRGMRGWKDLDLFEREAKVLKSLSHPGIPDYVDYFEEDTPGTKSFFLVQKMAPGRTLAQLTSEGMRFKEDEAIKIMLQVLDVLEYLESLRPPVVHRDIKPENIVFDPSTGKVLVVDFGGVQKMGSVAANSPPLGSTVVGTYGFMAPEQFQNRATTQSDLYSLGATMLYLLSGGVPPSSFPQTRLRIDFRSSLPSLSPALARVLEGLLQPTPEDRYRNAADVKSALLGANQRAPRGTVFQQPRPGVQQGLGGQVWDRRGGITPPGLGGVGVGGLQDLLGQEERERQKGPADWQQGLQGLQDRLAREERERQAYLDNVQDQIRKDTERWQYVQQSPAPSGWWSGAPAITDRAPAGSRVEVEETPQRLKVIVPPVGLTAATVGSGSFALAWNAFIAFWTASAASAGAPLLFTAFSIPFWVVGYGLAKSAAASIAVSVEVEIGRETFSIKWSVGDLWSHSVEGSTRDINSVEVVTLQVQNGKPLVACEMKEGVKSHQFGSGLEPVEIEFLCQRVSQFLSKNARSGGPDYMWS